MVPMVDELYAIGLFCYKRLTNQCPPLHKTRNKKNFDKHFIDKSENVRFSLENLTTDL